LAEIYKIEIHGIEQVVLDPSLTVKQGEIKTITIKLEKQYTHGTKYTIKLYLKSGTLYPVLEHVIQV